MFLNHKLESILAVVSVFLLSKTNAQKTNADSLRHQVLIAKDDTTKVKALRDYGYTFLFSKPDSSLIYYRQALAIAKEKNLARQEVSVLSYTSGALSFFPEKKDSTLLIMQNAISLARKNHFLSEEIQCYQILSSVYFLNWNQPDSGFLLIQQGILLADKYGLITQLLNLRLSLSYFYWQAKKFDEALQLCLDGIRDSRKRKLPGEEMKFKQQAYYVIAQTMSADTIMHLTEMAISFSRDLGDESYEAFFFKDRGEKLRDIRQPSMALQSYLESLEIYSKLNDKIEMAAVLYGIGLLYMSQQDYRQSLSYFLRSKDIQETTKDSSKMYSYEMIGNSYARLKMTDSAVYFARRSYEEAVRVGNGYVPGGILNDLGELYSELGHDSLAMYYFRRSLPDILSNRFDYYNECEIYIGMAKLFEKANRADSSVYYARKALPIAKDQLAYEYVYDACKIMTEYYTNSNRIDSAFYYQEMAMTAKDSLFNQDKIKAVQSIEMNDQVRRQQVKENEIRYRHKINMYILAGGLAVVLLIAGLLYRNNRQKQQSNILLQHQKEKVESTLSELKSTQTQLIQSEKMASLGELTAGIAHEIQNPLNFVNNFSDVNKELVDELKSELAIGNSQSAIEIADNIKDNEEKINHHGKRADSIVRGMLQHSRISSGQKELTDINKLADEYLRLAYHGLRAKDKSFNAEIKTDFDNSIEKINIVPQDIGRVILNLINNAFYAVGEWQKAEGLEYKPTVTVSTKRSLSSGEGRGEVLITVADNGNGIPQKIIDKIFQPFFTTKPTGQGTGLGLSLAYDIVKAHGGEIKVETKEGEGSEFIASLPLSSKV